MISLSGLDKAAVLAALYNASHAQGMGFLQYTPEPMSADEARQLLEKTTSFDYLKGRVMKIDLSKDELDPRWYDRDNGGDGAAEKVISILRDTGATNSVAVQVIHSDAMSLAADKVKEHLAGETTLEAEGGAIVLKLGLNDVADVLGPAVDKAVGETPPPGL